MGEYTEIKSAKEPSIGVVYLAWHALGRETFQRFAESYRRHPAGCDHDLIVIYAGFKQREDLYKAVSVFRDIPHVSIELMDPTLDIAYYLETARRVSHRYLCFVNTYTELTTANWLSYMFTHASREGVGIVGATGSYESLLDSFKLFQKIVWLCRVSGNQVDEKTANYFKFILSYNCPEATVGPTAPIPQYGIDRWRTQVTRLIRDARFLGRWETLTAPGMPFADYRRFPAFPNPHIRSNGFMVRRCQLVSFEPTQIQTKLDACAFESSSESLSAQLRRAGLAAIIVDNVGQGYDVPDWWRSDTFRLGEQSKLIMTDNRSREFAGMSQAERSVHRRITWGNYLEPAPPDFPDFGFAFAKGSLGPRQSVPGRRRTFYPVTLGYAFARQIRRGGRSLLNTTRSAHQNGLAVVSPSRRLDHRVSPDAGTAAPLEGELAHHDRISPMDDQRSKEPGSAAGEIYDREYYATHCGSLPYDRSFDFWFGFFGKIADELIRGFQPRRVFDAGCAHGFLVEAFRDRGVEAWGRDISEFANSNVRPDMRQYCSVGSIADPIEGKYDLVTCIEVLEHMPEAEAIQAIASMTSVTDRILFSSSPNDFNEPTHINVQPTIYWLHLFAAQGFAPDVSYDATFILPHTLVLQRVDTASADRNLATCAELVRTRMLLADRERAISELEFKYQSVITSTIWVSTLPLRFMGRWIPQPIRKQLRRSLGVVWRGIALP